MSEMLTRTQFAARIGISPQRVAKYIKDVLKKTGWRIKGENGAAAILGLNPSTLYSRMEKLGIPHKHEKFD